VHCAKEEIEWLKAKKVLKKVALERRKSIQEKCRKAEEGSHMACQKTTIASYFECNYPRRRKYSDDECSSEEVVSPVSPDTPGSMAKTTITLFSFDSNGFDSENRKGGCFQ
jgi:hypothetical protein